MSNGKIFVILQHEPNGAYDFREVNTPEQQKLEDRELAKFAKRKGLTGLKLDVTTKDYKYSHDWHDAAGNSVPVFKRKEANLDKGDKNERA